MKKVQNANFPQDADGRTYHVGVKLGQVANRIITVGDPHRAHIIAKLLIAPTVIESKRGFTTITGNYGDYRVSIIAIGMGMMDMMVREVRAVTKGPLAIIRFGSCGGICSTVGNVAVATCGIMITRNWDNFPDNTSESSYCFSNPVLADSSLTAILEHNLRRLDGDLVVSGCNATADSFYSSQGRIDPHFDDDNALVLQRLQNLKCVSLEMETFVLLHLAACSTHKAISSDQNHKIYATACAMVFADRTSNSFISPERVDFLESNCSKAILDTLIEFDKL